MNVFFFILCAFHFLSLLFLDLERLAALSLASERAHTATNTNICSTTIKHQQIFHTCVVCIDRSVWFLSPTRIHLYARFALFVCFFSYFSFFVFFVRHVFCMFSLTAPHEKVVTAVSITIFAKTCRLPLHTAFFHKLVRIMDSHPNFIGVSRTFNLCNPRGRQSAFRSKKYIFEKLFFPALKT